MLWQFSTPCRRSQSATDKLRTPWWQNTINRVSASSSSCRRAGTYCMGISVAPSMWQMACSAGSLTSIRRTGSPSFRSSLTSAGVISIGNPFTEREFSRADLPKPRPGSGTSQAVVILAIVILKDQIVGFQRFSYKNEIFPCLFAVGRICGGVRIRSDSGSDSRFQYGPGGAPRARPGEFHHR